MGGRYIKLHLLLALLGTSLAREDNQLRFVLLQSLDIQGQTLLARIASPMVDGNAQFGGLFRLESGLFEFFQSESSTFTDLDVVAETRAADCGTEEGGRSRGDGGGSLGTVETAAFFACRLVEPCPDPALPVLLQHSVSIQGPNR